MITYFRYVPHAQVAAYEAKGWKATDSLEGTSPRDVEILRLYLNADEAAA